MGETSWFLEAAVWRVCERGAKATESYFSFGSDAEVVTRDVPGQAREGVLAVGGEEVSRVS